MKSTFKLLLITLPLVLVGVGFVAYTISTKPAPMQEEVAERAVAVRVIEARKAGISPRATGFGLIVPARTYQAIAQVSGTVEYLNPLLKKGGILPAGAVLLRLSDSDYTLAVDQARANIRASEARLAEIEVLEANLKAGLAIEAEILALKERDLQRVRKLYEAGTTSQTALDGAMAAHLAQRQREQTLRNSLALLPTQRLVQTEQIAVYQVTLETAELNITRTKLHLPFAARVGAVSVEIGQVVRSGQIIAEFDGISAAEIEVQIPADDLQTLFRQFDATTQVFSLGSSDLGEILEGLGLGAEVVLKLGREDITWPATLDRISNTIDPKTGAVGVILRIDNTYEVAKLGIRPPLTKGMFVEAILEAAPLEGIAVPRSALRAGKIMLVDSDNRLRLVPVTVSFLRDRMAIITEGIEEGTQIVVSNPVPMIEGMLLDLHPDTELMQEITALGDTE